MEKADRDFIMKMSKKVDKACALAEKAMSTVLELSKKPVKKTHKVNQIDPTIETTKTYVVFDNPLELQKHSRDIMQINKNIDDMCKQLGVKELTITFKRP